MIIHLFHKSTLTSWYCAGVVQFRRICISRDILPRYAKDTYLLVIIYHLILLVSDNEYALAIGAKRSREVIYSVLLDACNDGDLTISEAIEAVERIFQRNALNIYNFEKVITSDGNDHSLKIGSTLLDRQQENIVFVRLVWVDNSGQQKCRVSWYSVHNFTSTTLIN